MLHHESVSRVFQHLIYFFSCSQPWLGLQEKIQIFFWRWWWGGGGAGGGWLVGTMVAVYVAVHSPQGSVCPLGEGTATHRLVPWGCGINVACSQNVAVGELKSN